MGTIGGGCDGGHDDDDDPPLIFIKCMIYTNIDDDDENLIFCSGLVNFFLVQSKFNHKSDHRCEEERKRRQQWLSHR